MLYFMPQILILLKSPEKENFRDFMYLQGAKAKFEIF